MKSNRSPFKGTWFPRVLALLLPFLLFSLVAWTADRQDLKERAGMAECDPMTACFLDLIMTLMPIKNANDRPVGPNQDVPWSQGPEDPPVDPPPNIIVILADDMGFDESLYLSGTFYLPAEQSHRRAPLQDLELMGDCEAYTEAMGVLEMPEGYVMYDQVRANSIRKQVRFHWWVLLILAVVLGAVTFWAGRLIGQKFRSAH